MSDKAFEIEIVTPEGVLYSGKADKFFAPGYEGYFEILFNHTPY
ncbi:F0F1 ATP synthase subunit epsilon, partial [candidate division KSB1 bacterium]